MEGLFWEPSVHLCVVYSPAFSVNNHRCIYEEMRGEVTGAVRLSGELQYARGFLLLCVHRNLISSPLVCFSWIRGSGQLASSWSVRSRPVCWQAVWRWHRVLSTTQTDSWNPLRKVQHVLSSDHTLFQMLFPDQHKMYSLQLLCSINMELDHCHS